MTTTVPTTMTPTVPPIDHREAMLLGGTAYSRFADRVEALGDDDWRHPTDCDGWTVRDLVGHVVGSMRAEASVREFVSQLREINRRVKHDGGNQTDTMTKVQIERTAELTNAELARQCRALVASATAGRRRVPAPLRRLVSFPVEIGSLNERWRLGYLVDIILTRDAWLHRIDLCRAIAVEPQLTPEHDGRIVADIVAEWGRRHGQPYELILDGPAGGRFAAGDPGTGETIEIDAVEFCRVLSGRAHRSGLLATEVPF